MKLKTPNITASILYKEKGDPTMHIRSLGRTDLKVFTTGFGTGTLGCQTLGDFINVYENRKPNVVDEEYGVAALEIAIWKTIARARTAELEPEDAQILIDTAALYGNRRSERIIGKVLDRNPDFRPWILVTTKVGRAFHSVFDYSLDAMMASLDLSHQLTGIDRFPIVYLHDPMGIPEDIILRAREDLTSTGEVAHVGVAANDPDTSQKYIETGLFPIAVVPEATSFINRRIEDRILPAAERHNVGLVIANSIEKGMLTSSPPINSHERIPGRHFTEECLAHMETIRAFCKEREISMTEAAWQLPIHMYQDVACSLIGLSTPADARNAAWMSAWAKHIDKETWEELKDLVRHFEGQRETK